MLGAVDVEVCDTCAGALSPSAELPPCLCRLEPVIKAEGLPEPKGTESEARALKCPACGAFLERGARRCGYCSVELASVRCWCCFELAFAGTEHCANCGSRLGLEGDLGPTTHRCPACDGDVLHTIDVGENRIEECPRCTAVFVDHDTLARITHRREAEAGLRMDGEHARKPLNPRANEVVYRPCPDCLKVMNRQNFGRVSGVIVDVCKDHGVFFDPEELTAVLEFVASGGLEKKRSRDLDDAREELRRRRIDALTEQHKASKMSGAEANWASSGAFITALAGFDW